MTAREARNGGEEKETRQAGNWNVKGREKWEGERERRRGKERLKRTKKRMVIDNTER